MTVPGYRFRDASFIERRAKLSIWFMLSLFILLVGKLFYLQVMASKRYGDESQGNIERSVPIEAARGLIKDRNGKILVDNQPSYTISYVGENIQQRAIENIRNLTGLDGAIEGRKIGPLMIFQPVKLMRDVGFEVASVVQENRDDLPGVEIQLDAKRRYLMEKFVSHVLGYVGVISQRELEKLKSEGYLRDQWLGKKGVELVYENVLKGQNGVQWREVNAVERVIRVIPGRGKEPKPGNDVWMTIDKNLQEAAERAFPDSGQGSLVAIDPRTGEVLAMVSRPNFDPNEFASGMSKKEWDLLRNDLGRPLLNRTIQGLYPPGSTFKLIMAAAALEMEIVDEGKRMPTPCRGVMTYGDRHFKCWSEKGHGSLDLHEAIKQSCDIYFYQLGVQVGLESWVNYAKKFGFEKETGIDLDGEENGLIPTREYFDAAYGKRGWSGGALLNLAIGQGETLVSPIQMACFIGGIATKGKVARPHLYKGSAALEGSWSPEPQNEFRKISGVSQETFEVMGRALLGVVEEKRGTGRLARVKGYKVAGKTGTSQNPHGEDHAWFIGFAPFEDPIIAVAAIVENSGHGGSVAAPLVGQIIETYLKQISGRQTVDSMQAGGEHALSTVH